MAVSRFRIAAVAAFASVFALAACNGGQSSTGGYQPPLASEVQAPQALGAPAMPDLSVAPDTVQPGLPGLPGPIRDIVPDAKWTCPAPNPALPGTYWTFVALGNVVNGTTFTSATQQYTTAWVAEKYVKATPPPTPKPTPTPTSSPQPTPKPIGVYIYYGTYNVSTSKVTGCALLVQALGRQKIVKPYNGVTEGYPNIKGYTKATLVSTGPIKNLVITNLSANGGTGTGVLVNKKGKKVAKLTVKLVGRYKTQY